MKELRLCDNGFFEYVLNLSNKYKLGIEVQSFYDPYIIEREPSIIQNHVIGLSEFQFGKSLHAPFWELNIGSKMRGVSQTTIEMFNFAYDIACTLGCTGVIVHNGYIPNTYEENGWINRATELWNDFLSDKKDNITFYIENQFELSSNLLCRLIDEVNSSKLKICLDIGHVNAHSNHSIKSWIERMNKRIGYVHMHNNNGLVDEHLGINNGTIPTIEVAKILEMYSPDAIWSIECNVDELEQSITFLKDNNII